jgi:hypothetical protein
MCSRSHGLLVPDFGLHRAGERFRGAPPNACRLQREALKPTSVIPSALGPGPCALSLVVPPCSETCPVATFLSRCSPPFSTRSSGSPLLAARWPRSRSYAPCCACAARPPTPGTVRPQCFRARAQRSRSRGSWFPRLRSRSCLPSRGAPCTRRRSYRRPVTRTLPPPPFTRATEREAREAA